MLSSQPYKGTRDFYPDEMRVRAWMFSTMREVVKSFGYGEYDGPMLEPFDLYAAKTGEEIVNQQLYSLIDRGERKLAIRPEMTPTMARMVAAKFHELPKPIRWFSIPNVWRYERPQRGRLREHWQLNVDLLGGNRAWADAEILELALSIIRKFGGAQFVKVKVNHRGLVDQVFQKKLGFTPEVALKVSKAVDAREKIGEATFAEWLKELNVSAEKQLEMEAFFQSSWSEVSKKYPCAAVDELQALFNHIEGAGLKDSIEFDPKILRGLDYYTGTVFEMFDISPENPRAIFGGGRYDNLLSLFGKESLSGVGLGMGDVTLMHFLETHKLVPLLGSLRPPVEVFVAVPTDDKKADADRIARLLRSEGFHTVTALEASGFGPQLKQASKLGARFVVLMGEAEWAKGAVAIKCLESGEQKEVKTSEISKALRAWPQLE